MQAGQVCPLDRTPLYESRIIKLSYTLCCKSIFEFTCPKEREDNAVNQFFKSIPEDERKSVKDLSARLQVLVGKEKQLTAKVATKEVEKSELKQALDKLQKEMIEVHESEKKLRMQI